MSKIKTKQLFNEVSNHIKTKLELEIFDSYSDWGNKSTVVRKNPEFKGKENQLTTEIKYFSICEFSVHKKSKLEFFVIWDYRENQPFDKSIYCVNSDFGFGRYEFTNRESFYNHINSDFGLTIFDRMRFENKTEII
jgi:hypothetical protein